MAFGVVDDIVAVVVLVFLSFPIPFLVFPFRSSCSSVSFPRSVHHVRPFLQCSLIHLVLFVFIPRHFIHSLRCFHSCLHPPPSFDVFILLVNVFFIIIIFVFFLGRQTQVFQRLFIEIPKDSTSGRVSFAWEEEDEQK